MKNFCPIMAIGFPPPDKGKRDMRVCQKDCNWYNTTEECCNINLIAERLEYLNSITNDIGQMVSEMEHYEYTESPIEDYYDNYPEPYEI